MLWYLKVMRMKHLRAYLWHPISMDRLYFVELDETKCQPDVQSTHVGLRHLQHSLERFLTCGVFVELASSGEALPLLNFGGRCQKRAIP